MNAGGRIPRIKAPSRLAVAAERSADNQRVISLLRDAGLNHTENDQHAAAPILIGPEAHGGLDGLAQWLAAEEDGHALLLHDMPAMVLARSMADGRSPAAALEGWREAAESVLGLVRGHRRRITLLPLDIVLQDPETFIQAIANRFDLAIAAPQAPPMAVEPPGAVFRLMAENAIWQNAEARHLAAELQASSLPVELPPSLASPAVDEAFEEFRNSLDTARRETEKDLAKAARENSSLQQELQETRQALETARHDDSRLNDLLEENDLLLQQLHHVQEELENYYLDNQQLQNKQAESSKLDKEMKKLMRQNEGLQRKVDYMLRSKSWKLTKPLRSFIKLFKRSAPRKAS